MSVYFVIRHSDGAIKIGTTRDLSSRLAELALESDCDFLASEPGSYRREADLHRQFRHDRMYVDNHLTEWFRPSEELMLYISSIELTHAEVGCARFEPEEYEEDV